MIIVIIIIIPSSPYLHTYMHTYIHTSSSLLYRQNCLFTGRSSGYFLCAIAREHQWGYHISHSQRRGSTYWRGIEIPCVGWTDKIRLIVVVKVMMIVMMMVMMIMLLMVMIIIAMMMMMMVFSYVCRSRHNIEGSRHD